MTDTVAVAIIANIGSIVGAFIIHMGQRNIKANVEKVARQTDGITSALVAATAVASRAEGAKDEKIRAADVANGNAGGQSTAPGVG